MSCYRIKLLLLTKIMNTTAFSNQSSNSKVGDDVSSFLFVKDLDNCKDSGIDSLIMNLIKHVKET